MKTCFTLPSGYAELRQIDLQKDPRLALIVNALGICIFVFGAFIGQLFVPLHTFYSVSGETVLYFVRLAATFGGIILYIFLHEFVHGIFIKRYSGQKAEYGYTGMYAYAGSKAYFNKNNYLVIALAPVVLWGTVLTVLLILLPEYWFWTVCLIQLANLSGAAGDLYVFWTFSRMPEDILIQDTGVAMTIYAPVRRTDRTADTPA